MGGGGKVKVRSGSLCICQGLSPSTGLQAVPCQDLSLGKATLSLRARKRWWFGDESLVSPRPVTSQTLVLQILLGAGKSESRLREVNMHVPMVDNGVEM